MFSQKLSIVITGVWPGAGQSTTTIKLAEKLGFSRVYAGFLFRKFAHVWNLEKERMSWQEFESSIVNNQISLGEYAFEEHNFNEKTLHEFQYQLRKMQTPELWDKIIDQQSLLALNNPGVVVEGKVGVLLDKTNLAPKKRYKHRIIKILLTCPPEISTHRIIKRKVENGEMTQVERHTPAYRELVRETTTETINRHLRDWERYEIIYGIRRSDIYKPGIIKVNTAERSLDEVLGAIIERIEQKLNKSVK